MPRQYLFGLWMTIGEWMDADQDFETINYMKLTFIGLPDLKNPEIRHEDVLVEGLELFLPTYYELI